MSRCLIAALFMNIAAGVRIKKSRDSSNSSSSSGLVSQVNQVPGRACDGRPYFNARVIYPSGQRNLPIFAFAHAGAAETGAACKGGDCDYAEAYRSLLEPIAEAGYLVIAFMGCPNSAKGGDLEMLDSIQWLRSRSGYPVDRLLPATVAGHAGGGWAALAAASDGKEVYEAGVGLAMALHPTTETGHTEPVVPTAYWAGEFDEQADSQSVKTLFDEVPRGVSRAFAVWQKKDHDSPRTDPADYIYWTTKVMDCKVFGSPAACSNRDEMCADAEFTQCQDEF